MPNPLKGKKMPKEWAEKTRKAREGKCGGWNKGKKGIYSEEALEKMRQAKLGHIPWNKGTQGLMPTPKNLKEKPSYGALHQWVRRWKGKPPKCEVCGQTERRMTWANISREYKRDLDDFVALCYSCHKKYDLGLIEL